MDFSGNIRISCMLIGAIFAVWQLISDQEKLKIVIDIKTHLYVKSRGRIAVFTNANAFKRVFSNLCVHR